MNSPQNSNRFWVPPLGTLLAILAGTIILYMPPHVPANLVSTALRCWNRVASGRDVPFLVTTEHITIAIDDQINSIIDLYAPFFRPGTPLLKSLPQTVILGSEDDVKGWNLPLTHITVSNICSSPPKGGSDLHSQPPPVCTVLERRLISAIRAQDEFALHLASPRAIDLWANHVRSEFLELFSALQGVSANLEVTDAGAAAHKEKQRTADVLYRHVDKGGRWHSINKDIRAKLRSLRQDCVSIANNLDKLYSHKHYDQAVTNHYPRVFAPRLVPVSHVETMISAIDGYVVALDAIDDSLLRLRTLLATLASAGWKIEELIDDVRIRVLIGLPDPQEIVRSVSERVEKMMADASEMQEAWRLWRKASYGIHFDRFQSIYSGQA